MTTELKRTTVEEGSLPEDGTYVHGPLEVEVISEVKPSDGSETLPRGRYQVRDLKWIAWSPNDPSKVIAGVATFVVMQPIYGPVRRIGGVRVLRWQATAECSCENCRGLSNFLGGGKLP